MKSWKLKVQLAVKYFEINNQRIAFRYTDEAFELPMQLGDTAQIVTAGRIKGQMLRRFDDFKNQLRFLRKLAPIAKRNEY